MILPAVRSAPALCVGVVGTKRVDASELIAMGLPRRPNTGVVSKIVIEYCGYFDTHSAGSRVITTNCETWFDGNRGSLALDWGDCTRCRNAMFKEDVDKLVPIEMFLPLR